MLLSGSIAQVMLDECECCREECRPKLRFCSERGWRKGELSGRSGMDSQEVNP